MHRLMSLVAVLALLMVAVLVVMCLIALHLVATAGPAGGPVVEVGQVAMAA